MDILDYRNSFVIYTSARDGVETNTCRILVEATCTLVDEGSGESRAFYLGRECIGEYIYEERIAQEPTSEVAIIFCDGPTALIKKFASCERDVIQIADIGQKRQSFDGSFAHWTDLKYLFRNTSARQLADAKEIIAATVDGETMVGRTMLPGPNGGTTAILEYPISYMNVHPPIDGFQVDVGPILLPRLDSDEEPSVSRMQLAYVMYNNLESVEFAVRVPTLIDASVTTQHYSKVVSVAARTEIFALGS